MAGRACRTPSVVAFEEMMSLGQPCLRHVSRPVAGAYNALALHGSDAPKALYLPR
jgi:hypothetical protein